ncbi:MAG: permease-like cell division protein FtsX [Oscillospiraceae bacterium]|nr:permease-like cell division protein FtsX [Oscillospiraceae bacterium]
MRNYSMLFFIKQSLGGLFMNGVATVTSVFVLTSCLILMGCFGFFMHNVNINLDQLDEFNTIIFFIDKDYSSEEDIERIKGLISALSNVKYIEFISRREALDQTLEEMREYNAEFEILENEDFYEALLRRDRMPDAIEIEYHDVREISTLEYQLKAIEGYDYLRNNTDIAEFITNLKDVATLILVWFLAVLFGIAVFIILNTVRLSVHSRKNEIVIMRYIGATNFFILFPFLLEGIIIGIFSALTAYLLQWYIYKTAIDALDSMAIGLKFADFSDIGGFVFVLFIVVGVLCGLIGSSISARKHLKA